MIIADFPANVCVLEVRKTSFTLLKGLVGHMPALLLRVQLAFSSFCRESKNASYLSQDKRYRPAFVVIVPIGQGPPDTQKRSSVRAGPGFRTAWRRFEDAFAQP